MVRAILSVIVGYVAISLWVFVTLGVAWFALGSEFAIIEGTHEASTGWSVVMIGMGAIGAVIGGLITASIGRAVAPVKVLAGLVLVVGLALAVYQLRSVESADIEQTVPAEELTMWQAMGTTKSPAWYNFGIPFVGCAGVLLGGRMRRRSESN